jgi:hypothetical protein
MVMKATITFEVTEVKTTAVATGLTGKVETMDITGTEIEKDLIKLLKKIHEHQLAIEVMDALDISKWAEVQPPNNKLN